MTDPQLEAAQQFLAVAGRAWQRGLVAGSGGNISVRIASSHDILVKPSGVASSGCSASELLRVAPDGTVVSGRGKPTKDLPFHLAIYRVRPDIQGIVHAHGAWATALTLLSYAELPLLTPHAQVKFGRVPVVPYATPGSPELEASVSAALSEVSTVAILLEAHGLVTVGATLTDAENAAELVEETAQIAWLVRYAGGGKPR